MAYWLVKSEPETYSYSDLEKERKTSWTGVKNATAQQNIRKMKKGDALLFYHTGKVKAVVGFAQVVKDPYLDPTDKTGKLHTVDIAPQKPLASPVELSTIKSDPTFKDWDLIRIGRLSVLSVPETMWKQVISLGKGNK
jgi:predicted RNA-binding protein with PUA-like domain